MTMTSFPWEKKSYPWNNQETTNSFPWQQNKQDYNPYRKQESGNRWQNEEPVSYQWQSSGVLPPPPPPLQGRFPWESQPAANPYSGMGTNTFSGSSPYTGVNTDPYTNPFDVPQQNYPWNKQPQPEPPASDLFVFGKKGSKKGGGGTYSSYYKEQQNTAPEVGKGSAPSSYSSIYNERKALFPWEKQKAVDESEGSESQTAESLKASEEQKEEKKEEKKDEDVASEDKEVKKSPTDIKKKAVKSPKSKKKASPQGSEIKKKDAVKKKSPSSGEKSENRPSPKHDIQVSLPDPMVDQEKEDEKEPLHTTTGKEDSPEKVEEKVESPKKEEDPKPITGVSGPPLSRSSSVTKITSKTTPDRVKSAPVVPRHINKKSEMLARNYMSVYAKPKISPKKEEKPDTELKTRVSYRKEQAMSDWIYPAPPEPVDWKVRSEQGLTPIAPGPDSQSQSEPGLDSASLREAVFLKWIEKKKQNKTFKKSDLVTVIAERDDTPSADSIRQEKFEEWYRQRAIELDKKKKEESLEEQKKKKEEAELAAEKKKSEEKTRRQWEEKDKERKKRLNEKKAAELKTKLEKQKEAEEKKKNAEKNFKSWKETKDPKLKEEAKKKQQKEKERLDAEREEKEMKEIEAQKSFLAWKQSKEQKQKEERENAARLIRQKKQQEILEKREKDAARNNALQQWNAQKEEDRNKVVIPQHISPWKSGGGGNIVISRDEQLMANIKAKKNLAKNRPQSARKRFDSETEVEFVNG